MNVRTSSRARAHALAAGALLAGCGGAVPPAAVPHGRSPAAAAALEAAPSAASATPPPAPAGAPAAPPSIPPGARSAAPPSPSPAHQAAPPPLEEPLPPLSRPLLAVNLPGVGPIASVHGRSPRDVWLLTEDDVVVHYDGRRVVNRYPRPCGFASPEPSSVGPRYVLIVTDERAVRVLGESRDAFTRIGGDITGELGKGGSWSCKEHGTAPVHTVSSGDRTWKLAHNLAWGACRLRAIGGPCAAVPTFAPSFAEPIGDAIDSGIHTQALLMRGLIDGWMANVDEEGRSWLLRYNGVDWTPLAALEKGLLVIGLWVDQAGHAWLTARPRDQWSEPGNVLLRYDGRALLRLPVPASFAARWVAGTGPRDVWFAGAGRKVYQWDGQRLRQGEAPFDVTDAWGSPGGEVWLVGKGGKGQAVRTAPLSDANPAEAR